MDRERKRKREGIEIMGGGIPSFSNERGPQKVAQPLWGLFEQIGVDHLRGHATPPSVALSPCDALPVEVIEETTKMRIRFLGFLDEDLEILLKQLLSQLTQLTAEKIPPSDVDRIVAEKLNNPTLMVILEKSVGHIVTLPPETASQGVVLILKTVSGDHTLPIWFLNHHPTRRSHRLTLTLSRGGHNVPNADTFLWIGPLQREIESQIRPLNRNLETRGPIHCGHVVDAWHDMVDHNHVTWMTDTEEIDVVGVETIILDIGVSLHELLEERLTMNPKGLIGIFLAVGREHPFPEGGFAPLQTPSLVIPIPEQCTIQGFLDPIGGSLKIFDHLLLPGRCQILELDRNGMTQRQNLLGLDIDDQSPQADDLGMGRLGLVVELDDVDIRPTGRSQGGTVTGQKSVPLLETVFTGQQSHKLLRRHRHLRVELS
jgi:hypothetical protein